MSDHEPAPAGQPSTSVHVERRAYVRLASDLAATCRRPASGYPAGPQPDVGWPGRVRDISRGGVRLLVNQRFEPGTSLRILLNKSVEARLVHATPAGENKWALGCEFSLTLSEQEIQNLLKSSTASQNPVP